jgi:hypothetical protein
VFSLELANLSGQPLAAPNALFKPRKPLCQTPKLHGYGPADCRQQT